MRLDSSLRNTNPYFFLSIIAFFSSAFWLQKNMMLHGDVAYLIYVARLVLAGKTYGIDFFETNPPMILYLYIPVLFLAKKTSIALSTCFIFYVLFLALNTICIS